MKTSLLHLLVLLFFATTAIAQTNVTFNIHHKLGDNDFAMETEVTNNIGNNFDFTRLEYYIAEISLIHDGGQETIIEERYMLVEATEVTTEYLGEYAITDLEAIRFHVGVNEGNNHTDPTTYHSSHPLSPQLPSMHWGWASGYRFGAFEGNSGDGLNQLWQIHALEDENYFQTEIALELSATSNELVIDLDADYIRALENIDLSSGPITHGGYGDAKTSLQNFQEFVFSPSSVINNSEEPLAPNAFQVYPNPGSTDGTSIYLTAETEETYQLTVTNAQGQMVRQLAAVRSNTEIELVLETAGLYFLNLYQQGEVVITKKLVIQ